MMDTEQIFTIGYIDPSRKAPRNWQAKTPDYDLRHTFPNARQYWGIVLDRYKEQNSHLNRLLPIDVLDLGCASGSMLSEIANTIPEGHTYDLWGVDWNEVNLRHYGQNAQKIPSSFKPRSLNRILTNLDEPDNLKSILEMTEERESSLSILSMNSWSYLSRYARYNNLQNIKKSLDKKGGVLQIFCHSKDYPLMPDAMQGLGYALTQSILSPNKAKAYAHTIRMLMNAKKGTSFPDPQADIANQFQEVFPKGNIRNIKKGLLQMTFEI